MIPAPGTNPLDLQCQRTRFHGRPFIGCCAHSGGVPHPRPPDYNKHELTKATYSTRVTPIVYSLPSLFVFVLSITFHFPVHLVRAFTFSDLLDEPWSQVSSLPSPGTCPNFFPCIGFSVPSFHLSMFFDVHRFFADSRSRAFLSSHFGTQEKVPTSPCI